MQHYIVVISDIALRHTHGNLLQDVLPKHKHITVKKLLKNYYSNLGKKKVSAYVVFCRSGRHLA